MSMQTRIWRTAVFLVGVWCIWIFGFVVGQLMKEPDVKYVPLLTVSQAQHWIHTSCEAGLTEVRMPGVYVQEGESLFTRSFACPEMTVILDVILEGPSYFTDDINLQKHPEWLGLAEPAQD